jgi:hypothetical protein
VRRPTASTPPALAPVTVTVQQAMAISGLSRATFYNLFADGRLKPRKYGTRTLILYAELVAFLHGLPLAGEDDR